MPDFPPGPGDQGRIRGGLGRICGFGPEAVGWFNLLTYLILSAKMHRTRGRPAELNGFVQIRQGLAVGGKSKRMVSPPVWIYPRRVCVSLLVVLLSVGLAWAKPKKTSAEPSESLVAIGDVHGDFDDFVALLQHIGLIDKQNHWTGGKTTLVQVGDILDRGPKPREVMDLMMALEREAGQAGGRVVSLLGNHEMMNIMGDLRYVTPVNYGSFADSNSEKRQKSAYEEYAKWRNQHPELIAELSQPMELTEAEWMARHPLGFVEQREAFSPKGEYGKWLRGHNALAEIGREIFLHGGIDPEVAKMKVDAVNKRIRDEIQSFDAVKQSLQEDGVILPFFNMQEITYAAQAEVVAERKSRVPASAERQAKILDFLKYGEWLSVKPDGPLWFRGYDQWSDAEGTVQIDKVLDAYKVAHIVVGHTVQRSGRIRPRFGDKVFLIDTGMFSSYYPGGRASALEICGDSTFTAKYMDQQVVLIDPAASPEKAGSGAAAGGEDAAKISGKPDVSSAVGGVCAAMAPPPQ
ncbi:MAG: metallophosphoesterase [Terriglobales bacterium]